MARGHRATAFSSSFPTEVESRSAYPLITRSSGHDNDVTDSPSESLAAKKRRRDLQEQLAHVPLAKRPRTEQRKGGPPTLKRSYAPSVGDVQETAATVLEGEGQDEEPDPAAGCSDKPVRVLHGFVLFDSKRDYEYIPLNYLHDPEGRGRNFEAAGNVTPAFLNDVDEDAAQDEDLNGDYTPTRFRTSSVFNYSVDYTNFDEPLYIQTTHTWYMIRSAESSYHDVHMEFYRPHRIAQMLISASLNGEVSSFAAFHEKFVGSWDHMLNEELSLKHLPLAAPHVKLILDEKEVEQKLSSKPDVRAVLQDILGSIEAGHSTSPYTRISLPFLDVSRERRQRVKLHERIGNIDLHVLRPENQNQTHVTPRIDHLAWGLFHERLHVVGPPTKRPTKHELKQRQREQHRHLLDLLTRSIVDDRPVIFFPADRRLTGEFWQGVIIDDEMYEVGSSIVVRAGEWKGRESTKAPEDLTDVPADKIVADYFWFAKILYIDQKLKVVHVQWYEHASKTYLKEISDPQELFLCPLCGTIDLLKGQVLGKVKVQPFRPDRTRGVSTLMATEFFSEFIYNQADGSFTDIETTPVDALPPGDNCSICSLGAQYSQELNPNVGNKSISHLGTTYHVDDYALLHADNGPAMIGRILAIHNKKDGPTLSVQLLGRMVDVDPDSFTDERELFTTSEEIVVKANDLLKRCVVIHPTSVPSIAGDLHSWLSLSPLHFFVERHCPTSAVSYTTLTQLKPRHISVCGLCFKEHIAQLANLKQLSQASGRLRGFDPFAGVGAFGLGMERAGCVRMTHAVEISPSAADTLKKNCPSTVVYNQCANTVLKYAIKTHAGQYEGDPPLDITGEGQLPPPPQPGQVDCIVAGFPCQPHSALNMFQKAHDRKSHLILTLLSWVDFLRPKYCFFENVRGFLRYNLHATQANKHSVEGGINRGGLKFLVHALLSMGYQVRFGLLQAGHYGAPQDRVRFFLIASQRGCPLPLLPQPSHSSLEADSLQLVLSEEVTIKPILTAKGTAALKHVTISEAIGDLLQWDWENPEIIMKAPRQSESRNILTIKCDSKKASACGPDVAPDDIYSHKPLTSYQRECRGKPTTDIQHFTLTFRPQVVESVVSIPLRAKADYRELPLPLWEWQNAHPLSFVARKGNPPGFYGRLDKDGWFHTIVTNVRPMAKQSYVIHHWCHRILSVRELARSQGFPDWFVFTARDKNVTTIHRQIGNAVPWQVGEALGRELRDAMLKRWMKSREEAIEVDSVDSE